ncbi:MAG: DUF4382 domain-containing protein [gamma proteobacterium endosymbiont of Lamellibrachia anaximandri]|nr:DUF4382 domain-containing protein [gamma proteobacterium endosymbiont of Lamellibrachia anaximandri]MBL3617639.1 DUF4382 domain-containing protein [gamma proteobacterium endosymbiont of Lamellibrachia anaximandri]
MTRFISRIASLLTAGTLITALVSCGGGSGSDTATTTTAQRSGTVGILLTDKPADPSLFTSINASIARVELMGSENGDRVVLYSGEPKTVDLLRLRNEAIPFTFREGVPVGVYCKIRLTLNDLELVLTDDTPGDMTDNETYHPDLPGNGKLDLVTRDCFTVEAGKVVTLQLDLDAGSSIHVVGNNNGFNFRPVVFVDVLSQAFDSKLVRLVGEITEVDPDAETLLLCGAVPAHLSDGMRCVKIYLGDDAAFFDYLDYAGTPRPMDELLSDDKIGERATIVGWPRYWVQPHMDVEIPYGHYPPPGECRLWHLGLEAGQQPPPGDCETLKDRVSENIVLISHEGIVKDKHHPLMEVDALVVEVGEFLQVEGEVATDADPDGFSMAVTSSGPVIITDTLAVALQADYTNGSANPVNGTRIVSKSGEILDYTQVIQPRAVQVDGILDLTGTDALLKSALVIVDTGMLDNEQITGTVLSVDEGGFILSPGTEMVCGIATTQLAVILTEDAEFLTVIISAAGSEIIPGGVLEVGQSIGMNGTCEPEGYVTDNVVIMDDQRD